MLNIKKEDKKWAEEIWEKLEKKLSYTSSVIGSKFPYTTRDGKYEDFAVDNDVAWWTNGFWPCMMLQMYHATGENKYLEIARGCCDLLDEALYDYDKLIHDVGFMWDISSFADYRLTGDYKQRQRGLTAAAALMSRYNLKGGFIRAWNMPEAEGWAIIDCMMNLPLLYRASEAVGDDRFIYIAESHAEKVLKYFIRPDGSSEHVVDMDPVTGEMRGKPVSQGYDVDAAWSRGQSWAIYGFALIYSLAKKPEYLDAAKRVAHYFIANIDETGVPDCDFRAPDKGALKDSTAGVCAACGMIEIARNVPEREQELYLNAAMKLLRGITENCCNFSTDELSIVQMGTESYHSKPKGKHIPIIYGDSFYLEAIQKLLGNEFLFW